MFTAPIRRAATAAALSLAVALPSASVHAADHRDGTIAQDMPADIADTYVFLNPNDPDKVVLGVTVNPYIISGVNGVFSPDVLYQLKIDNNGDFVEDLVIQATYDNATNAQNVKIVGPGKPRRRGAANFELRGTNSWWKQHRRGFGPTATVPSNATVQTVDLGRHKDVRIFSGRTDDPFFIDLIWVRSLLGVIPPIDRLSLDFAVQAAGEGKDLFTGLNVSSLMIELPVDAVFGNSDHINVWSTASRAVVTVRSKRRDNRDFAPWIQVDREGFPALNAALVPPPLRDQFNRDVPANDLSYLSAVEGVIAGAGPQGIGPLGLDTGVASVLLPDVLPLSRDPAAGGFDMLNGRAPADDFIDFYVFALTAGGVTVGDGVAGNDPSNTDVDGDGTADDVDGDNFPDIFPFLALEHIAGEGIPAGSRN